ncbi:MAG: hypothetical protein V1493_05850 [Candidatus Diapherotrites archaeon]
MKNFFLMVAVFGLFFGYACASYITLSVEGAPFVTGESITFHGTIDGNADVNVWAINSGGTVVDQNYLGSRTGSYAIEYSFAAAGDYNIFAEDLNNDVNASMQISVSVINSVQINYDNPSYMPPFDLTSLPASLPVTFTAYNAGDLNVGAGQAISISLLDSTNTSVDSNSGTTNGDGNVQLAFHISGFSAGEYYFSVNNGLAVFPFSIYSFRMFMGLSNPDTNNAQSSFRPGGNGKVTVDVMNYAGTGYISGATVGGAVYNSSNVPQSALSFSSSGGSYYASFTAPATTGDYYLDVNVAYGGSTQSQKISFKVENYAMELISSKFAGGGMGEKEKMPSVFPTSSAASLELHFSEIDGAELSGSQLTNICNNGAINDHNFILYYKKVGANDWNATLGENDVNVSAADSYCLLSFRTPASASTYYIQVNADDLNVEGSPLDLSDTTMITVQNYLVFMEPVDPSTCDTTESDVAASCGFKFQFTMGEKIGLRPTVIDMTSSTSINQISALSSAIIYKNGSETMLSSPADVNFRSDLNIIEINPSSTVQSLTGGFYTGGFTVNVNSNGALAQSNVTAFGFFYLKVLNATTTLVDVNGNSISTNGPPTYASDKNTYLKVTVLESDGTTAIRGAVVTVSRIMNFRERETIDVSGIDANATNSSGVATLVLDYAALGMGSGEFEVELDINAATAGKTDTVMTHFERRNYYLDAMPLNKADCGGLPMVSGDMNSTFLLNAKDAWRWTTLSDLNASNVQVFYEGSPSKPLSQPVEMTVSSFTTGTIHCGDKDYNYVDVNHNGTWAAGFYKFKITVQSTLKGTETTNGFVMVQPFFITAMPAAEGQLGMYAAPGAQWDFNIMSSADVNITAKIMDVKNWSVFASDLNMHIKSSGLWISGSGNTHTGTDIAGQNPPLTYATIDVNIPSNLPLAKDMEMDGYIIDINAVNAAGQEAIMELFIIPQKWQILLAKEPQGSWSRSEPGPYMFTLTGDNYMKMDVDSNVIGNCQAIADERGYTAGQLSDAGKTYSRIIMAQAGSDDVNGTERDWNAIVLVNPDTEQIWVDRDNDCNFNEEPDSTALTVGDYVSGIWSNKMYESWDDSTEPPTQYWYQNPYNGMPVITGIMKSRLTYTTADFAEGDVSVLSYASMQNMGTQRDPFMGTVDTDHNLGVPIIVKDLSGNAVAGATVQIQSVMLAEMGGGMPTALAEGTDYNAFDATTDGNGLAIPKIAVNNSGIIMLGFKVSKDGSSQSIMPWSGAVFQAKSYTVVTGSGLEDLNIQFDQNAITLGLDINSQVIPLACFDGNTTLIGVLNEKSFSIRGTSMAVNLDNDSDENRAGIVDENWYFIPLTGDASCPNATFGSGKAKLLIDDDKYIDTNMPDGWYDGQTGEFGHYWPNMGAQYVGASQVGGHQDLNEITVESASAFPICLYGAGKCSADGQGYNPGSYYDLNSLADNNISDGNLLIYNLFDYRDQFYNPATYGSSTAIKKYLRVQVRDTDYTLVSSEVRVSGSVFNEMTGLPVISNFSGIVPDGSGRRIELDGNFSPAGQNGSGFTINIDVNYSNDIAPTFGFMWSRRP